jgi:hypothetical protein
MSDSGDENDWSDLYWSPPAEAHDYFNLPATKSLKNARMSSIIRKPQVSGRSR